MVVFSNSIDILNLIFWILISLALQSFLSLHNIFNNDEFIGLLKKLLFFKVRLRSPTNYRTCATISFFFFISAIKFPYVIASTVKNHLLWSVESILKLFQFKTVINFFGFLTQISSLLCTGLDLVIPSSSCGIILWWQLYFLIVRLYACCRK